MDTRDEFHTLNGYRLLNDSHLTESMEDYLEMIFRLKNNNVEISIKNIAEKLHERPSSVSKMCRKLCDFDYLSFEKYGAISLSEKGIEIGSYLFWRHTLLERLLKKINDKDFCLEQVEKIEHFIDDITLHNLERFLLVIEKDVL